MLKGPLTYKVPEAGLGQPARVQCSGMGDKEQETEQSSGHRVRPWGDVSANRDNQDVFKGKGKVPFKKKEGCGIFDP